VKATINHDPFMDKGMDVPCTGLLGGGGLFLSVRKAVLFPYFVGRGHFFQIVLRLVDRRFVLLIDPLGGDPYLQNGKLSESGPGMRFLIGVTSMLAWPVEESCLECPNLNMTLERLVDGSVPPVPGFSDFDHEMKSGTVVGSAPSRGSEYCNVTQYIARAFTMT